MMEGIDRMQNRVLISLLCFVLLAFLGCEKRATNQISNSPKALPTKEESPPAEFDACGLIKKEEIEAIQGSPITNSKSSASANGGFRVWQCFYTAGEFSRSVSLAVTQSDPNSPAKRSVPKFWKETFGRFAGEQKDHECDKEKRESPRQKKGTEREEEAIPPKIISGVGDDAYWAANRVGGALYVLKKDAFIRISVGGADTEEAKIDKSKALAEKALARM